MQASVWTTASRLLDSPPNTWNTFPKALLVDAFESVDWLQMLAPFIKAPSQHLFNTSMATSICNECLQRIEVTQRIF